jgi:hypothetical protein
MTTPSETPPANVPPPSPQRPFYKQIDFWAGFIGWYVVNGALWGLILQTHSPALLAFFVPLANLVVLVITAFVRRRLAGGMLLAIALNFLIAIVLGLFTNAVCGTLFNAPFFIPLN